MLMNVEVIGNETHVDIILLHEGLQLGIGDDLYLYLFRGWLKEVELISSCPGKDTLKYTIFQDIKRNLMHIRHHTTPHRVAPHVDDFWIDQFMDKFD